MRVRIEEVGEGQHPSEKLVRIETRDGPQELIVDKRSIVEQSLDVGFPVGTHGAHYLVELPQETFRGDWRVWVEKAALME